MSSRGPPGHWRTTPGNWPQPRVVLCLKRYKLYTEHSWQVSPLLAVAGTLPRNPLWPAWTPRQRGLDQSLVAEPKPPATHSVSSFIQPPVAEHLWSAGCLSRNHLCKGRASLLSSLSIWGATDMEIPKQNVVWEELHTVESETVEGVTNSKWDLMVKTIFELLCLEGKVGVWVTKWRRAWNIWGFANNPMQMKCWVWKLELGSWW